MSISPQPMALLSDVDYLERPSNTWNSGAYLIGMPTRHPSAIPDSATGSYSGQAPEAPYRSRALHGWTYRSPMLLMSPSGRDITVELEHDALVVEARAMASVGNTAPNSDWDNAGALRL